MGDQFNWIRKTSIESFSINERRTKSLLMPTTIIKREENNPIVLIIAFCFYLIFHLQFIFAVLSCYAWECNLTIVSLCHEDRTTLFVFLTPKKPFFETRNLVLTILCMLWQIYVRLLGNNYRLWYATFWFMFISYMLVGSTLN